MVKLCLKKREQELWFEEWIPAMKRINVKDYQDMKNIDIRRCVRNKRAVQILATMYSKRGYIDEQAFDKALTAWKSYKN